MRITSGYGVRTLNGRSEMHRGVDFVGDEDKNVIAVCGGTVRSSTIVTDKSNLTWQWGNYVAVTGDDGVTVYYCHLQSRAVVRGQQVKAGDVIGIEGATGYVTGRHLHFETRRGTRIVDASAYLGVPNRAGDALPDAMTCSAQLLERCGLEEQTRSYLNGCADADALWRKLWRRLPPSAQKTCCGEDAASVIASCGLEKTESDYISSYKYASDLWKKLGAALI